MPLVFKAVETYALHTPAYADKFHCFSGQVYVWGKLVRSGHVMKDNIEKKENVPRKQTAQPSSPKTVPGRFGFSVSHTTRKPRPGEARAQPGRVGRERRTVAPLGGGVWGVGSPWFSRSNSRGHGLNQVRRPQKAQAGDNSTMGGSIGGKVLTDDLVFELSNRANGQCVDLTPCSRSRSRFEE